MSGSLNSSKQNGLNHTGCGGAEYNQRLEPRLGSEFLPISRSELIKKGIDQLDFIYVSGDAYVDHPSFGAAIITRVLEHSGFSVGFIAQPDWRRDSDFTRLGRPRLAFLVSSGNIDSMVAHYTVAKKRRDFDAYSPGNKPGKRPDRAVTVYTRALKRLYPEVPVLIGGLEASLRRFAHYDYWEDCVKPSVLFESGADLLMFGMGENCVVELAKRLRNGQSIDSIRDVRGTCYLCPTAETPYGGVECPSFEQVKGSKELYARACRLQYDNQDEVYGRMLLQRHGDRMLVQNPPPLSLDASELDLVYSLPYTRTYHPVYEAQGGVPAISEVRFSITHNRGCFGFCNFCSIALHQGRRVTARSHESVIAEARLLTSLPDFKGYINDVGGPTANFRQPSCRKQLTEGLCKGRKCLAPKPCPCLEADHSDYLQLLRELRSLPGVKKVFIRSGIRYDYLLEDKSEEFLTELIKHHISGQLRVAPEHCSGAVLDRMGKPHIEAYKRFKKSFDEINKRIGREQYVLPYLMSSHPGSTLKDAVELALFLRDQSLRLEQVQDFYPTPGTISTCMYYTGLDPYTMKPVYVARDPEDKAMQRALLQYYLPANRKRVIRALRLAGREDLIGTGRGCLVRPEAGDTVRAAGRLHSRTASKNRGSGADNGKKKKKR